MCKRADTNGFLRAGALLGIVYFLTRGIEGDAACFINGMAAGLYLVLMVVGLYRRGHAGGDIPARRWKRALIARLRG